MTIPCLLPLQIQSLIDRALEEDLGRGDITSSSLLDQNSTILAHFIAREDGIICGVDIATQIFHTVNPEIQVEAHIQDGDKITKGQKLLSVNGNARSVLGAERAALNFMSHLSAISTKTDLYVREVQGTHTQICCTRKTLPGLRLVQKYAVRCGGGQNHRYALDDAILIKDNHIAACGSVSAAIERALENGGHMTPIEVEVDTLEQYTEAQSYPIHAILLDNMTIEQLHQAVKQRRKGLILEASGGITLSGLKQIAQTGIDIISVGGLTHSIKALDIGLDIVE